MENEVQLFGEKFGELIQLPGILKANQERTVKAKAAALAIYEPLEKIPDFSKMELCVISDTDTKLNELMVKLEVTVSTQKGNREPFTQFFDTVRSAFTAEEKIVTDLKAQGKRYRDKLASELSAREAARQLEVKKKADKANEAIEIAANVTDWLTVMASKACSDVIGLLHGSFYKKTVEQLDDALVERMKAFKPKAFTVDTSEIAYNPGRNHTAIEVAQISQEAYEKFFDGPMVETLFTAPIAKVVAELVDKVHSRKAELIEIANDDAAKVAANARIETERKQREADDAKNLANAQQSNTAQLENDKIVNTFEVAASAAPIISGTKGAVKKLEYKPANVGDWAKIMQNWVKNELPGMSLEQLEKKLGFMLTAANKNLAAGEVITGLPTAEIISTRTSKVDA